MIFNLHNDKNKSPDKNVKYTKKNVLVCDPSHGFK